MRVAALQVRLTRGLVAGAIREVGRRTPPFAGRQSDDHRGVAAAPRHVEADCPRTWPNSCRRTVWRSIGARVGWSGPCSQGRSARRIRSRSQLPSPRRRPKMVTASAWRGTWAVEKPTSERPLPNRAGPGACRASAAASAAPRCGRARGSGARVTPGRDPAGADDERRAVAASRSAAGCARSTAPRGRAARGRRGQDERPDLGRGARAVGAGADDLPVVRPGRRRTSAPVGEVVNRAGVGSRSPCRCLGDLGVDAQAGVDGCGEARDAQLEARCRPRRSARLQARRGAGGELGAVGGAAERERVAGRGERRARRRRRRRARRRAR